MKLFQIRLPMSVVASVVLVGKHIVGGARDRTDNCVSSASRSLRSGDGFGGSRS
jgi:hypothetical protein